MKTTLRKQLSALVQRRLMIERRGSKRVVPVHRTICLIQSSSEDERRTASVHNISYTGIVVHGERAYEPGTLLRILLINEAHTFSLALELNVTRSLHAGDRYLIAGTFAQRLSHAEVAPFIL
jgi:hypothetical protein